MFNKTLPEAEFAIHTIQQACLLVRQIQAELVSPALTKDDRSPVTVADFACQALVGRLLSEAFPNDWMVAEEDSSALRGPQAIQILDRVTYFLSQFVTPATPETVCAWIDHARTDSGRRFWTLDPIDGTKGFLRGDQYALALALIEDGQVQLGVLGCPNLLDGHHPDMHGPGSLVVAVRGEGAWTTSIFQPDNYRRLHVSNQSDPRKSRLLRSFEAGHTNVSQIDDFAQALGIEVEPMRMDSQAKYAVLASGEAELILRLLSPLKPDYREKIWDQAAGSLILEEAGGYITDLDGKPLDFTTGRSLLHNRGLLASNRLLHAAALEALRAIRA